jgi:uncharacterized coiled-coil DUF342 family protein
MKSKAAAPRRKSPAAVERLQRRYAKLRAERDRLREELAKVRAERDEYSEAVGALWSQFDPVDEDELVALLDQAQSGKLQSAEELIAELEAEAAKQCRPRKSRRTK